MLMLLQEPGMGPEELATLAAQGWQVEVVRTPAEALQRLADAPFQVLLVETGGSCDSPCRTAHLVRSYLGMRTLPILGWSREPGACPTRPGCGFDRSFCGSEFPESLPSWLETLWAARGRRGSEPGSWPDPAARGPAGGPPPGGGMAPMIDEI